MKDTTDIEKARLLKTFESFSYQGLIVPHHDRASLARYITEHSGVGGFLTAVIQNDLAKACVRADTTNLKNLPAIVIWLRNEAPSECWGSPEKNKSWLKLREVEDDEP
jgi:hypothetical protein